MTSGPAEPAGLAAFSEKGFYLAEFRGRTLVVAGRAEDLAPPALLEGVLKELEANDTRVVLVSGREEALAALLGTGVLPAASERLEGAVWRALRRFPRIGVLAADAAFATACCEIALRLGVSKLVWLDPEGGLRGLDGVRQSFVDRAELRAVMRGGPAGESPRRIGILREIEAALDAGLASLNLCTPEGLADELFTYAGSGTLFTRQRYVEVRKLKLDDFDAAHDLISRGVAEGYLAPRSADEIDRVLANAFGAFVEGRHLAGIGALLVHERAAAGEIASLYTLTRFLGEGVGGYLVAFALERARAGRLGTVFACTASDRVVAFFERHGFARVAPERLPPEKWRGYDPGRRARVTCLLRELTP